MNRVKDIGYVSLLCFALCMIAFVFGVRVIASSNVNAATTIDLTDGQVQTPGEGDAAGLGAEGANAEDLTGGSDAGASGAPSANDATTWVADPDEYYSTHTTAEIFRIEYIGQDGTATVSSADGSRVIAPGTSNTYVFNVANSSGRTLDYTLDLGASALVAGFQADLPIQVKLSDYTGRYIVGSADSWANASELADARDAGVVSSDHYIQYTLEWQWPYEGNDAADSLLGMVASGQDVDVQALADAGVINFAEGDSRSSAEAASSNNTGDGANSGAATETTGAATEATSAAPVSFGINFTTVAEADTTYTQVAGLSQTGDRLYFVFGVACVAGGAALMVLIIAFALRRGQDSQSAQSAQSARGSRNMRGSQGSPSGKCKKGEC